MILNLIFLCLTSECSSEGRNGKATSDICWQVAILTYHRYRKISDRVEIQHSW